MSLFYYYFNIIHYILLLFYYYFYHNLFFSQQKCNNKTKYSRNITPKKCDKISETMRRRHCQHLKLNLKLIFFFTFISRHAISPQFFPYCLSCSDHNAFALVHFKFLMLTMEFNGPHPNHPLQIMLGLGQLSTAEM